MAKRTKWTAEEDEILVQAIKDSPKNKAQAFRRAASKVNHSESSCSNRWYSILSNTRHGEYMGGYVSYNEFMSRLSSHTETKRSLWSRIKTLLGL